jgi:hypothetical protein
MFPDKSCRLNQNSFFKKKISPKNLAVYEVMWKNMVEPERPQVAI